MNAYLKRMLPLVAALTVVLALIVPPAPTALAQTADPLAGLGADIESWMPDWHVPGVAVAVVKDDKVVFSQGFGVLDAAGSEPVDDRTVFSIGSATKAFTAASAGLLVDEGKLEWDSVLSDLVPEFAMKDAWVTDHLTIRDALSHRSGLDTTDPLWYAFDLDRKELVRRLRYFEPTWGFRSHFGYQNLMYVAAGRAVEEASGVTWEDFVTRRILEPLGMTSTATGAGSLTAAARFGVPHGVIDGRAQAIPPFEKTAIGPAGSIRSTAADMARWVRFNLNEGTIDGQPLLSAESAREMQTPQTIIRMDHPMYGRIYRWANFAHYGLGWFLADYAGHKVVEHAGSIDGFSSLVSMMPDRRLGLVVLTNQNLNLLPDVIRLEVYDRFLGRPDTDWNRDSLEAMQGYQQEMAAQADAAARSRVPDTRPSLPLDRYAGAYDNGAYGRVTIRAASEGLQAALGEDEAYIDLQHWHYDRFALPPGVVPSTTGAPVFLSFTLGPDGTPLALELDGFGRFERVP